MFGAGGAPGPPPAAFPPMHPVTSTTTTRTLRALLPPTERLGEIGLRIAITAIVAILVVRLAYLVIGRAQRLVAQAGGGGGHAVQRARTLGGTARSLATVVIVAGAAIHALEILGWNVGPLLAGAGVLGLAIGFGAQTLVRDVIAGLFILAEDQYAIGDVIEINGVPATVEDIAVRATTLRDGNGYVHFVPNGEIRSVTNRSRGWNRASVEVVLPPEEDPDRALGLCRGVVTAFNAEPAWRDRLLDAAEVWGIESLARDGVRVRLAARALPGADAAAVERELCRRVLAALIQAGIFAKAAPPAPPPGTTAAGPETAQPPSR